MNVYTRKNVLELIKATLGCGRISTDRNTLVFTISQLKDIESILIPLFEQFPLNTKKYLDYLDFKKAFFMYVNRNTGSLNQKDLDSYIIQLKDSMNDKRVNFDLPENLIKIAIHRQISPIEKKDKNEFKLKQKKIQFFCFLLTDFLAFALWKLTKIKYY